MNLDNVANNLANSSTAGFRRRRLQFEDLLYQTVLMPGAAATQQTTVAAGLQIGLGTRTAASEVIQTQGDFSATGNPLDLTIQGQGFFQVTLPSGETAYTRSGAFQLDAQGNMVTADGNPLQPGITIPAERDFDHHRQRWHGERDPRGTDSGAAGGNDSVGVVSESRRAEQRGQQSFSRHHGVRAIRWWERPEAAKAWERSGRAYLEQSNVNVVEEFVQMIVAQRSYEANSRVVQAADEMMQGLNSVGR